MSKAKREAKAQLAKEQELAKLRAKEEAKQAAKQARREVNAEAARKARVSNEERRAKLTPKQRHSEDRRSMIALVVLLVLLAGLVVSCLVATSGDDDEPRREQPEATTTTDAPRRQAVPDVVGEPLNRARSTMHDLGFDVLAVDCTGRDRLVVRDSNWYVTDQDPRVGGTQMTGEQVTLCVVKYED